MKDKAAAESHLKRFIIKCVTVRNIPMWTILLIGDSHSDNAYAGTTGAEVVPYETNSIDASNSVLSRDWNRYLEDIAQANVLIW